MRRHLIHNMQKRCAQRRAVRRRWAGPAVRWLRFPLLALALILWVLR